jgi:uncharacterized YccA/Bax inhibitor family protein
MEQKPFKTGNPAFRTDTFNRAREEASGAQGRSAAWTGSEGGMTLAGTVTKSFVLLALTVAGAAFTWHKALAVGDAAMVFPWMIGALIIGFILAMVIIFVPKTAPILAPFYAVFEGLMLGGLSAYYEGRFPGMVIQAVGLTFGTCFAMLVAFSTGLIKVTEKFKLGVIAATGGIAILYFVDIVMGMAFHTHIPMIHESGMLGIGFSVFVVILAALNLVLDFDFIKRGSEEGAPKFMEWYGAFGLLVTLVWLYLEILRLLAKGRSR